MLHPTSSQTTSATGPAKKAGLVGWLSNTAPTALVLAMLAGVAYFGYQHEWRLPKFSELNGDQRASQQADWCAAHGVPESQCVECNPALLPKPTDYGWCKDHGVSQCPLCHPDVAQMKTVSPASSADLERVKRASAIRPRAENNPQCKLYRRRIQFESLEAIKKVGLDVEPVERGAIEEGIAANGEITYDETRVAHLAAKAAGTVWRVERRIGDHVSDGDLLALIDAGDVGRAKAEFFEGLARWEFALATRQRVSPLAEERTVAGSRLLEAEAAVREARSRVLRAQQQLVNLGLPVSTDDFQKLSVDESAARLQFSGLPNSLIQELDPQTTTSNLLPVRAHFDGMVVACDVVAGEAVDTSRSLFTVADTRQMWLTLEIPTEESEYVTVGRPVRFQLSGKREEISGRIDWISTEADTQTRTLKVRAVVENPDGKLRSETFGAGKIVLRTEADTILVPAESVQWDGSCQMVFVRDKNFFDETAPKVFYARPVRLGARTEKTVEILAGLLPGEVVVTKGSGILRGELLKNNLGPG